MRPIVIDVVAWSTVCLYVCLLETTVIHAQTALPIETLFGMWSAVGPVNSVLDGGPWSSPTERGTFEEGKFPPFEKHSTAVQYTAIVNDVHVAWRVSKQGDAAWGENEITPYLGTARARPIVVTIKLCN